MKSKQILKQAKSSAKKRYIRKKDFARLAEEVSRLHQALQGLQGDRGAERVPASAPEPKPQPSVEAKPKQKAAAKAKPATTAEKPDNLKRISGIGPVLEKKLNTLGIQRVAQIAAFTQQDIDRVSEELNFKGRIERDGWVAQAKSLEAGSKPGN